MFQHKNKILETLYSKKIKLGSKLSEVDKLLLEKTKQKTQTEKQLIDIDNELIAQELPNYVINLRDLQLILSKSYDDNTVNGIMQSCLKKSIGLAVLKRNESEEQVIDVTVCTCEGRMNVCVETESCPIEWKSKCDGRKISAAFLRNNS